MATITAPTWENFPSTATPRNATNLNKITTDLTNINNEVSSIDSRVTANEADISGLDTRITANEADISGLDTRITANEADITNLQVGWLSAEETWTYSSVDDPTGVIIISGDKTSKYSLGMRIKFTNGGNTIYGIVTKVAYSSPNTILTFLHEINPSTSQALHLMQNSAITANYYSMAKIPYGFPINPDKWTLFSTAGTSSIKNPTQEVYYNVGGNIVLGVGLWELSYDIVGYNDGSTTDFLSFQCGWGTTTSNQDITNSKGWLFANNNILIGAVHNKIIYEVTSPETLYLNACTTYANTLTLQTWSYGVRRKAVCAYL